MRIRFLMAALLLSLESISTVSIAARDHGVRGHVKKNGTYVAPTRATNPNRTQRDNYSSKPNINPSNGKQGTKNPVR
jgi:hypothetical protein